MRKVMLALVAVLALAVPALAATTAGAAQASARVGCFGNGCNGLDPNVEGCGADAITVDHASTGGVTIELRWSAACGANWARISPAPQGWQFRVQNNQGHSWTETVGYNNPSWYGNMVNGSGVLDQACFLNGVCTGWH
jgi:hypothetical protein